MTTAEVGGRTVELSHEDKQLYPRDGFRKRDVLDYYRDVSGVMVPHLRGKPLTLRRFPDGVGKEGFYQKDAPREMPEWVRVEEVPQRGGGDPVHHVVCENEATLVYLANKACLELHVGLSTVEDLERPVLVVFDLDPAEQVGVAELRAGVRSICARVRDAGLTPHVQLTGGKGFHVAAPLRGDRDFEQVRAAARGLAETAAREEPQRFTTEQRKDKRGQRIYLDINRNAYGQTVIAPYSLRARDGAPAATPLDTDEVPRARPRQHGMASVPRRLAHKRDPWSGMERCAATFPPESRS